MNAASMSFAVLHSQPISKFCFTGPVHCVATTYSLDLIAYVPKSEHRPGTAEDCDDDVGHYCQQALTGPRAGVWGIGVAGRCLSKTLAQGQYMAQGCKSLVIAAAPKVRWHISCMLSPYLVLS